MLDKNEQTVSFTLLNLPTPATKTFKLVNGKIEKTVNATIYAADGETVTLPASGLADFLVNATKKQGIVHGVNQYSDNFKLAVKPKPKEGQPLKVLPANTYARTKENFVYPAGGALALFDIDPDGIGRTFDDAVAFLAYLSVIFPPLATCGFVAKGSVSAGVHKVGEQPKKGSGYHIYVFVKNGQDIPRFGDLLFKKMVLAGLAYIVLSGKGSSLLIRTVFDKSVFSPERPDFISPPQIIGEGLEYTPQPIEQRDGGFLDTSLLLDLTPDEQARHDRIKAKLKRDAKPESEKQEKKYLSV